MNALSLKQAGGFAAHFDRPDRFLLSCRPEVAQNVKPYRGRQTNIVAPCRIDLGGQFVDCLVFASRDVAEGLPELILK